LVKGTLGRPTVLSKEEEDILVERMMIMADWDDKEPAGPHQRLSRHAGEDNKEFYKI
jgi:hypothetical protein